MFFSTVNEYCFMAANIQKFVWVVSHMYDGTFINQFIIWGASPIAPSTSRIACNNNAVTYRDE
ncbi:MAG: hypothetical protein GY757_24275 [bacterium]|nr:hypothetical protein [bacterium]